MSIKTSFSNLCAVLKEILDGKVDKVSGKGLSTNDFTTAYKTKLDGIAAEANKITVDSALSGTSTNPVQNKVVAERIGTIETNVSAAATTAGNAAASAAAVKKDLVNYYKKTETYSQTEINNKISAIPKFDIKVCEALPDSNISKTTVYLLKSPKEETNNLYDEYIYVDSKWEKLGTQTVGDIAGLSQRMTAAEANIEQNTSSISTINANVAKKQDKLTAGANITISGTTISAKDTTYSVATSSTNGLMSKDDKNKLDRMAAIVVDDSISTTSTNTIQNKAVGLKFQGVDSEISGINSSLTAKTAEIAMIVNEYGSKNLLSLKTTVNKVHADGLNVSFLDNGGIRVYGTKTTTDYGDLYFKLAIKTTLRPNTKYTLTSVNSAPNAMTVRMHLIADKKTIYIGINISNVNKTSITFTTPNASNIYVKEYVITVTDNNPIDVSVYPMLRYAAIKDDTYVPYAMTNRELTEKVVDTGWITTGNLKYRKSGYIVALQGTVTPSGSTMSITLGTLPENCRPSQDINIAQAGTDTPSRQIIVQKDGSVVLLFASNCTASHTYAYNGIFMI